VPDAPTLSPRLLWIFRLPDRLYRHGLGWSLGRRFLRLVHVGRRTGRRHATVLEVVRHDPRVPEFLVVSGFGPGADWLRNLEATAVAEVTVGRWRFAADHRRVDVAEAVDVFADYERRNRAIGPVVRHALSWLLGWRYDGSVGARQRMAEQLPMIALRPATARSKGVRDESPGDDRQDPRRWSEVHASAPDSGAAVRFPFPPALFIAPLAATLALHRRVPWPLPGRPATTVVGAGLTATGIALSLSGAATALRHRTTVVPHHPAATLVTTGPFRLSRNPMYTGLTVGYVGAALWAGTGWPLPLAPLCVLATDRLVIRPEEAYLADRFGGDYARYSTRVRRWL
jgi:deazaflavin-dependent oxidoreductase (nitroreductase family)